MRKDTNIKYDLEDRTTSFARELITFIKTEPETLISLPILRQLIRSGTSIGANYAEANDAESRKDFKHKIALCKKETRETKYWLRLLKSISLNTSIELEKLAQEAKELHLIFNAIYRSTINNSKITI